jgi:hypothetical protein
MTTQPDMASIKQFTTPEPLIDDLSAVVERHLQGFPSDPLRTHGLMISEAVNECGRTILRIIQERNSTKEPIDEKPPRKDYGLIPCPFCGNLPHVGLGKKRHCQLHGEPMQGVLVYCTSNNCVVKPLLVAGDIYNGGEEAARKVAFATWNRRL